MNDLSHHGIKGQKWGVRNGPPYPLDRKASSDASKKKKTTAKSFVERHSKTLVSKSIAGTGEEYIAYAVSIAAYFGAIYVSSKISESISRKKKSKEIEELNQNKSIENFDKAPKLSKKMSASESMKVTNPDFPDEGTTMNCTFCTTAMALREKGYDVRAGKLSDGTYADMLFEKAFNSPEIKMPKKQTATTMLEQLSQNGEGSYGNLTVSWTLGGAHSVFWKVENGKTKIYDGQNGKEYTESSSTLNDFTKYVNMNNIKYNRLDNCNPTDYALAVVESNKKK